MTIELKIYCNKCDSSNTELIIPDDAINLPIITCNNCSYQGLFGVDFSYLEIKIRDKII